MNGFANTREMSHAFRNVKDFGAIGDGMSHPLKERYTSLDDARVDYPCATSLENQTDWAAIRSAINYNDWEPAGKRLCGTVFFPPGVYVVDPIDLDAHSGIHLLGAGPRFQPETDDACFQRSDTSVRSARMDNTVLRAAGAQRFVLRIASQLVTVEAMMLDGNFNTSESVLLLNWPAQRVTVRNVVVCRTQRSADRILPEPHDPNNPLFAANLVSLDGPNQNRDDISNNLFDDVTIEQYARKTREYAAIGIYTHGSQVLCNFFRRCRVNAAANLVTLWGGGARFYDCDFEWSWLRAIEIRAGAMLEVTSCYTETRRNVDEAPVLFLEQTSVAATNPSLIVLRDNQINNDTTIRLSCNQPALLSGNKFGGDVEIVRNPPDPDGQPLDIYKVIAVGNVFSNYAKFTVTWTIQKVDAGSSGSVTVRARLDSESEDSYLGLADSAINSIDHATGLNLTCSVNPPTVTVGDILEYRLTYTNSGSADAHDVVITAVLQGNTTFIPPADNRGIDSPRRGQRGFVFVGDSQSNLEQLGTIVEGVSTSTNRLASLAIGRGGQNLPKHLSSIFNIDGWTLDPVLPGRSTFQEVNIIGARPGDPVVAGFSGLVSRGWQISGYVVRPDWVVVSLTNISSENLRPAPGGLFVDVWQH